MATSDEVFGGRMGEASARVAGLLGCCARCWGDLDGLGACPACEPSEDEVRALRAEYVHARATICRERGFEPRDVDAMARKMNLADSPREWVLSARAIAAEFGVTL
jgi:hypothetical protein